MIDVKIRINVVSAESTVPEYLGDREWNTPVPIREWLEKFAREVSTRLDPAPIGGDTIRLTIERIPCSKT